MTTPAPIAIISGPPPFRIAPWRRSSRRSMSEMAAVVISRA